MLRLNQSNNITIVIIWVKNWYSKYSSVNSGKKKKKYIKIRMGKKQTKKKRSTSMRGTAWLKPLSDGGGSLAAARGVRSGCQRHHDVRALDSFLFWLFLSHFFFSFLWLFFRRSLFSLSFSTAQSLAVCVMAKSSFFDIFIMDDNKRAAALFGCLLLAQPPPPPTTNQPPIFLSFLPIFFFCFLCSCVRANRQQ